MTKKKEVKEKEVKVGEVPAIETKVESKGPTDKEILEALYKQMKDLGINSIGDVEVRISRL